MSNEHDGKQRSIEDYEDKESTEGTEDKRNWGLEEDIEKRCIQYPLDRLSSLIHEDFKKVGSGEYSSAVTKQYLKKEKILLEFAKLAVEFYKIQQNRE